jgi:hypothetical protein
MIVLKINIPMTSFFLPAESAFGPERIGSNIAPTLRQTAGNHFQYGETRPIVLDGLTV